MQFSDEENKFMKIIEKRNNIIVIDFKWRTPEQNKKLKEYGKILNTEYKESYTDF